MHVRKHALACSDTLSSCTKVAHVNEHGQGAARRKHLSAGARLWRRRREAALAVVLQRAVLTGVFRQLCLRGTLAQVRQSELPDLNPG